ncbi:glycosyltransferase 61 family protein [Nocardioides sp. MAHUQ-72]|uniref:glycosyltransferase family 61 protein n=1 Tax=unclassified Nocardioides TaxID=2615069 RepID=UPI0036209838
MTDGPQRRPRKKGRRRDRDGGALAGLESLVPDGRDRRVLLVADAAQRRELVPWLERFSKDRVCVVSADEAPEWDLAGRQVEHRACADLATVVKHVRMLDAPHIVVSVLPSDLLPTGAEDQLDLFAALFRFVRRDGAYILDRLATGPRLEGLPEWLHLLAAAEDRSLRDSLGPRQTELASAVGTFAVSRDAVVVTKRVEHLVKLRDAELNRILPAREPDLTLAELDKRPGGELTSRARVTSHTALVDISMPSVIAYPELTTRHYSGQVALGGASLMYAGHTVLPDSFRWHLTDNPSNPNLRSESRRFARVPSASRPRRTLTGDYYQLESTYPHHFGHLMTEVVSRLWGWEAAKREIPDLKAIFQLKTKSRRDPRLERTLFTAYGISEADLVWVNEPVFVESVVAATPMWHNAPPHYVHPDIVETWDRLAAGLVRDAGRGPHERIFVSRGAGAKHRECRNAVEVEEFFRARGFEIVYPELLSLPEQVVLFRDARVVAGFGGSAMFNLMFAKSVETVVLLSHEAYTARNEHLYTSLTGGDVHYFWSRPDVEHPEGGWSQEAFTAAWEFDFGRNGDELAQVLAQA